jgi:S1-C subfamily serine protease
MTAQRKADLALAYHQDRLMQNQNLAYLSVVPRLDERGRPTKAYYIEAGVIRMEVQEAAAAIVAKSRTAKSEEFVPSRLAVPSEREPSVLTKEFVEVEVVQCGEVTVLSHTDRRRPCEGGNSVGNPRYNNAGTLGAPITIRGDSANLYFLSNWHVLVGGSGRRGDPLIQPGRSDGGRMPADQIGTLHWFALDANLDAAIGKASRREQLRMGTRCFGNIAGMSRATVGMPVRKCGRTSRATSGTIRSVNATVRVGGYPSGTRTFTNQIQTTFMLSPGDSGSVLINGAGRVVGLGFAGSGSQSFHNHIASVSAATMKRGKAYLLDGLEEEVPRFQVDGFVIGD